MSLKISNQILKYSESNQNWKSFEMRIDSTGTAPTKGTTTEKSYYKQRGNLIDITYTLRTTVAGAAGTGTYIFRFPNNWHIDTSFIDPTINRFYVGTVHHVFSSTITLGHAFIHTGVFCGVSLHTFSGGVSGALVGQTNANLDTTARIDFSVTVPIKEFRSYI